MIFIHDLEDWYDKPKLSNMININWDLINKFNEILYDRIGLIFDVKATYDLSKEKYREYWYYHPVLRSPDYVYYYETNCTVGYDYKEDRLTNCAGSIVREYHDNIDNQGNIEFTPLSQLPDIISGSKWDSNTNDEIAKSINDLVNYKIDMLRCQLDRGLSNVMRY